MLNWLFGRKPTEPAQGKAQRGDDQVWMSQPSRRAGVMNTVGILVEAERSVLVVALSMSSLESTIRDLARFQPVRCAEIFAEDALRTSLAKPGSVAVALTGALRAEKVGPVLEGVDIVVIGRHDTRAADLTIEQFADALGRNAHLTFHLALDDPLLTQFGEQIRPLLAKLGGAEDEPITHALVTRAIENAQRKAAG